MKKLPLVLLVMDGFGLGEENSGNAIFTAHTPVLDALLQTCPHTSLIAAGTDVGLPAGQQGNSEVGHLNIGAGRVVRQDLPRISDAIADGSFFENPAYVEAMENCREKGTALHILSLLTSAGVHAYTPHIWAVLELAKRYGLTKVYIHLFTDGRDEPPRSGLAFMKEAQEKLEEIGLGKIATIQGRFFAMDRDKRWERLQKAYDAIMDGIGIFDPDPVHAIEASYAAGIDDEFIEPVICDKDGKFHPGDAAIFMNFRPDRARELTRALADPAFSHITRRRDFFPACFVCTTEYDERIKCVSIAFPPETVALPLGEYISRLGMTQLHIAETEKYAHVTFFFNGGREKLYPGEDRVLILSSRDFPTYDYIPEMSAYQITEECVKRIQSGKYDFVICNLANCDMVGHTGVFSATVEAVEIVDECVGRITQAVKEMGGIAVVTADHGNADRMYDAEGGPCTSHTINPVPLIVVGTDVTLRDGGRLADIAPTILELMGRKQPEEMTGESLIVR